MSEEVTEGCKLRSGFDGLEACVACHAITDAEIFNPPVGKASLI